MLQGWGAEHGSFYIPFLLVSLWAWSLELEPELFGLYARCTVSVRMRGLCGWEDPHPPCDVLEEIVGEGQSYVYGGVVAAG